MSWINRVRERRVHDTFNQADLYNWLCELTETVNDLADQHNSQLTSDDE